MKKYAFRLETVRRVRRVQEAVAKAELSRANSEVQQAIAAVEARIADYERKLEDAPAPQTLSGTGGAIVRVDAFMKRRYFNELSAQAVAAARSSLAAAQLEASVKRDAWSETAKKIKALDNLDARRREEHLLAYNRELDTEVDDIVTGRFARMNQSAFSAERQSAVYAERQSAFSAERKAN
jgi:flagellar export protein FliJ